MARRRRRKKSSQSVTYDSKETRTIFGLLSILGAIIFFIAAIIDPTEPDVFAQIRHLFGQTTIIASIFLLNFGLFLFESKLPFANKVSVFAQFMLLVFIPAFLTSLHRSKSEAVIATDEGLSGGQVGFLLAYELFADTLVFGQYTPLILGILILIFAPLALSLSVSRLVDYIQIVFGWLARLIGGIFHAGGRAAVDQMDKIDLADTAKRFGDFSRGREDGHAEDEKPVTPIAKATPHSAASDLEVRISEKEMGEAGLLQTELAHPNWQLPPVSLLSPYRQVSHKDSDTDRSAKIIEKTLASFSIDAEVADTFVGPSVVRFALSIPLGTKVSKIAGLSPTLALGLGVDSKAVRVDTIPGTSYLGIEVPRQKRDFVQIREIMESSQMQMTRYLPMPIGKDIDGSSVVVDLQRLPHLLIAGATGSGKSVLTNSFIVSLLMKKTPDELRMIMVDPKQVELMDYNGIPHLLTPVITEMDKVLNALKWTVGEMERRYSVLSRAQVRNVEGYNKKIGFSALPYIVIVIDEMADMMMTANRVDTENAIVRLTQKARAVGIHLVLATQRPSVNVITGLIKANVPARIGMNVTSNVDSRVILDTGGAESLMGQGDLLYKAPDVNKMMRLQGPVVTQEEVVRVVNFIKSQVPEVEYMSSILEQKNPDGSPAADGTSSDDELFAEAVRVVVNYQKGSASFIQRKLNVGFNRAARLLEEMEEAGVVGPQVGSKPREVLISDADAFLAGVKG